MKYFFSSEDAQANWIGFILIAIASFAVLTGLFDFSAAKFSSWKGIDDLFQQLSAAFFIKLAVTFVVLATLFTVGITIKGEAIKDFFIAFTALFLLAILVRIISAQFTLNRYLEWAFFALLVGLFIANTTGLPSFIKTAVKTEYYIKTGLVIMGFSVLFSNIVNFGFYGLAIAWFVTPVVIIFMWWFGLKVLKMTENKPLLITLSAATSVCGTSAAIATAAASRAKKDDLSLAVSISIIFTVLMMVFEPILIKAFGLGEILGGALIGGTVDSTGAVVVAGTALGETAQTYAVLVKSIQNILIGFIAFAVAVFFTTRVENNGQKGTITVADIWHRIPKFIIGFFSASLIASFIILPAIGKEQVSAINKVLDQYKNWAFILAFISIGLETNFRDIKSQMSGGKPLILYIVGQSFNIVLTLLVVYLVLSGKFFPLPEINMMK